MNTNAREKKQTVNISLAADTRARLRTFAAENHTTVSQAITDWIWRQPLKSEMKEAAADAR